MLKAEGLCLFDKFIIHLFVLDGNTINNASRVNSNDLPTSKMCAKECLGAVEIFLSHTKLSIIDCAVNSKIHIAFKYFFASRVLRVASFSGNQINGRLATKKLSI